MRWHRITSDVKELGGILDGLNTFAIGDVSKNLVAHGGNKMWHTETRIFSINQCEWYFNERSIGVEIV